MTYFNLDKILSNITYEPQLTLLAQISKDEKNGEFVDRRRFYINKQWYILVDSNRAKTLIGPDYNYIFIKDNGYFCRWGEHIDDDPLYSPIGPEILDLEISVDECSGMCPYCYKGNTTKDPYNMTLDAFKKIINKIPKTLTQIAFGITNVRTNPDFIPMMKYCREIGIVPNFTLTGITLTDSMAEEVSKISGAVAVSVLQRNKDICYDTIEKFTKLGMGQVNMHLLVSEETKDFAHEVLYDRIHDPRLKDMNAIVFLSVKPKGRAKENNFHPLKQEEFQKLIDASLKSEIRFGFDSCSAPAFEKSIKQMNFSNDKLSHMLDCSESCESYIFSSYINVYGECYPCSFSENEPGHKPIDILAIEDYFDEVWYSDNAINFRKKLISGMVDGCRYCPVFEEIN